MKIYMLDLEVNPHRPTYSHFIRNIVMSANPKDVDDVYEEYPHYHYEVGKELPALILVKREMELPFVYEHKDTLLEKDRRFHE